MTIVAGLTAWAALAATACAVTALAADPSPTAAGGGDVRTNPAAPGLVGDPLFALAGVLAIGALSIAVTLVAVRLSSRRG